MTIRKKPSPRSTQRSPAVKRSGSENTTTIGDLSNLPAELLAPRVPVQWRPHTYQKRAVKFVLETGGCALFLDPGLGKTSITLGAFKILQEHGYVDAMLVVAPLRAVYEVWPDEVNKWLDFKHLKVGILHGSKKERTLYEPHDIYVINPEGLAWLAQAKNIKMLPKNLMLVVDESTKFKHTNTLRFRILKSILPKFIRRVILTGTPVPNGLMDLFGQIFILDMGHALGAYITHFRLKYFSPTGFEGHDWILQDGAEKKILKAIKPLVLRLAADDYLELPPIIDNYIFVDLPPKARKIYDDMEEEMIAELESGQLVTAIGAGSALKKCEQIANGGLYFQPEANEDGIVPKKRVWDDVHSAKIDAVADLMEELSGGGACVTYDFKHDHARLQAAFGPRVPYIGAGIIGKPLAELRRAWNAKEIHMLLGHFTSMSHALNLQEGWPTLILHSLTWDLEAYDQLVLRFRRQGSTNARIFRHHIIARDTVDEAKMLRLRSKDKTQKGLLSALRGYVRKRK